MFWRVSTLLLLSHRFLKEVLGNPLGKSRVPMAKAMFVEGLPLMHMLLRRAASLEVIDGHSALFRCFTRKGMKGTLGRGGTTVITSSFFSLMQTHSGKINDSSLLNQLSNTITGYCFGADLYISRVVLLWQLLISVCTTDRLFLFTWKYFRTNRLLSFQEISMDLLYMDICNYKSCSGCKNLHS